MSRRSKKICLITSGAGAIGRATAYAFKKEGATVILSDDNQTLLDDAAESIGCYSVVQNLTDEREWEALIAAVERKHGRLDVLVNNACSHPTPMDAVPQRLLRPTRQRKDQQFSGVESVMLGCRFAIPAMRRTGGGTIINIFSYGASSPNTPATGYGVSRTSVGAGPHDGGAAITAQIRFGLLDTPFDVAMTTVSLSLGANQYDSILSLQSNTERSPSNW